MDMEHVLARIDARIQDDPVAGPVDALGFGDAGRFGENMGDEVRLFGRLGCPLSFTCLLSFRFVNHP